MSPKASLPSLTLVALGCLAAGLYPFVRSWTSLAPPDRGLPGQILDVFLVTGDPERALGASEDLQGMAWLIDVVGGLLSGRLQVQAPGVFHPTGVDLGATGAFAWLDLLPLVPVQALLGPLAFWNLYLLLLLSLQIGVFTFLYRRLGAPLALAWALGVLAILNPNLLHEIDAGRPTQAHYLFHGLFLISLHQLLHDARRPLPWGALCGLLFAASCYVYWFSAFSVGLLGAGWVGLHLLLRPRDLARIWPGLLALFFVAGALVLGPTWRLSSELLLRGGEAGWLHLNPPQAIRYLGLFTASTRCYTSFIAEDPGEFLERLAFVGYPAVLLVVSFPLLVWKKGWRARAPLMLAAWGLLTLPFGSVLRLGELTLPTIYTGIEALLPPLARCLDAPRLIGGPLLGLLGSLALASGHLFSDDVKDRWSFRGGLGAMLLAAPLALLAPFPRPAPQEMAVDELRIDPFLLAMTARFPGGVIDVPLAESNLSYFQQILHRQVLLGGPGVDGRNRPPAHRRYQRENDLLYFLDMAAEGLPVPSERIEPDPARRLWDDGFRLLYVHPSSRLDGGNLALRLSASIAVHFEGAWAIPLEPARVGLPGETRCESWRRLPEGGIGPDEAPCTLAWTPILVSTERPRILSRSLRDVHTARSALSERAGTRARPADGPR